MVEIITRYAKNQLRRKNTMAKINGTKKCKRIWIIKVFIWGLLYDVYGAESIPQCDICPAKIEIAISNIAMLSNHFPFSAKCSILV